MKSLQLARQEQFDGITCDFYNNSNQLFMTRNQIGNALKYDDPNDSIRRIHERHKERLDKFSSIGQLDLPSGGTQTTYLYSQRGIFEICRWSRQPKANAFMDWVWDIVESYRNGTLSPNIQSLITPEAETMIINLVDSRLDERLKQNNHIDDSLKHPLHDYFNPTDIKSFYDYSNPKIRRVLRKNICIADLIRCTIKPLAELYNDKSVGYNNTYRKVYAEMNVDWNRRKTHYKNVKGNQNRPTKIKLMESDKKLLSLFTETVEQSIAEFMEVNNNER